MGVLCGAEHHVVAGAESDVVRGADLRPLRGQVVTGAQRDVAAADGGADGVDIAAGVVSGRDAAGEQAAVAAGSVPAGGVVLLPGIKGEIVAGAQGHRSLGAADRGRGGGEVAAGADDDTVGTAQRAALQGFVAMALADRSVAFGGMGQAGSHIGYGVQGEIAPRAHCQDIAGIQLRALAGEVAAGDHGEVAARRDAADRVRGGVGVIVVRPFRVHRMTDRRETQVATGQQLGVLAGRDGDGRGSEVAAGGQAEVAAGSYRCSVEIEVATGADRQIAARADVARLQVAQCHRAHRPAQPGKIDRAERDGCVDTAAHVVAGHQADVAARADRAAVEDVLRGTDAEVVAGAQRAAVEQVGGGELRAVAGGDGAVVGDVAAGGEDHVLAGDGGATGGQRPGMRCRQVHHRHQHLLAVHRGADQPHHVPGEAGHLPGRQRNAHAEIELPGHLYASVHQRAVLRERIGVVVEEAATGERGDLVEYRTLFVETVTQPLAHVGRVDRQLVHHVVAADELAGPGEARVGLDQIRAAGVGLHGVQARLRQRDGGMAAAQRGDHLRWRRVGGGRRAGRAGSNR